MRSQIAGITQGVRNAQDGISMIQTFEGALTETDSILQRMKTLADQSANGTYQDDVDRDAIQLEFDQLNDELNQIADTDFNGVIVLNGGEMSDGTKAVDGKFDYNTKKADIQAKIDDLTQKRKDLLATQPIDIFGSTVYNTIDENKYGLDEAKNLWKAAGLDAEKDSKINVTISISDVDTDGNPTYKVDSAVTDSGKTVDTGLFTPTAVNKTGDASGQGGFKIDVGGDAEVNVIFDASHLKAGDVITIQYDGPGKSPKAPANGGFIDDSVSDNIKNNADLSVTTPGGVKSLVKDEDMTAAYVDILDKINGAEVEFSATATTGAVTAASTKIGGQSIVDAGGKITVDGVDMWASMTGGKITISSLNASKTGKGEDLIEIDLGTWGNAAAAPATVKMKIGFDSYQAPADGGIDARAIKTQSIDNTELMKEVAKIDKKIATWQDKLGVSVSDAYDNGSIPMTYTDHITLQSGARSKDAVDFTFKYSCGGMGELKSNMNCSAREDGLNTENLYLTNAKEANYAIDRIDHAINKVSMVRATFGAVQNRLEHKIDNMNVTKENLTSAESRIRDTNIAEEMANFTRNQILSQASQSMLAQANSLPQGALQLLG